MITPMPTGKRQHIGPRIQLSLVTPDDIVAAVVFLDMALPWLAEFASIADDQKVRIARGMRELRDRMTKTAP